MSLIENTTSIPYESQKTHDNSPSLFDQYETFPTIDWPKKLSVSTSTYGNCRVVSITWVKALASPLSHEYVQFIVEDTTSGNRRRLIADRQDTGDWIIVGWNWASGEGPSVHHRLPLPLVSLTFDDVGTRPDVRSLAEVIADVTAKRPGYNIMKEMCWWYAESVLEGAHKRFGGKVREWKAARFRYSFIVRTNVFPRKELSSQAAEFMKQNVAELMY